MMMLSPTDAQEYCDIVMWATSVSRIQSISSHPASALNMRCSGNVWLGYFCKGRECRSHLLGGHAAAEHSGGGEVPAVARVRSAHHVFGVPHLLSQLGHAARTCSSSVRISRRHVLSWRSYIC